MLDNFELTYQNVLINLRSTNLEIRRQAIEDLRDSENKKAIPYLIEALAHEADDDTRYYLIYVMSKFDDPSAFDPLLPFLQHHDFHTRREVIQTLPLIDEPRAIEVLKQVAFTDKEVRVYAIRGLGGYGPLDDEQLNKFLREVIEDENYQVRAVAAATLGYLNVQSAKDSLISLLQDPYLEVRTSAAEALGYLAAKEALKPLMEFYQKGNNQEREVALLSLGKLGCEEAKPIIVKALSEPDKNMRRVAIQALIALNDSEELLKRFDELDKDMRFGVLNWLREKNISVEIWINLLNNPDNDQSEKEVILKALGFSKDERAIEVLIEALQSPDIDIRSTAAWALGEIKSERVLKPLLDILLEDPELRVKEQAARGLIILGNSKALEPLIQVIVAQQGTFPLDFFWYTFEKRSIPFLESLVNYPSNGSEIIESVKETALETLEHIESIKDPEFWQD